LDVSLPDGNGLEFLPEIKKTAELMDVPVFILTVDGNVLSKVAAFGIGADDYICKPFNALELRSRVEARLKRNEMQGQKRRLIGDLVLDQSRMQVWRQSAPEQKIELTPNEFKLLFLLSRRPEVIYSRQQILDEVWGPSAHITDRTVDAHVSHLRKKIEFSRIQIETVAGVGYKLILKKAEAPPNEGPVR
jgi:DNA-binding response OmpR family regulator